MAWKGSVIGSATVAGWQRVAIVMGGGASALVLSGVFCGFALGGKIESAWHEIVLLAGLLTSVLNVYPTAKCIMLSSEQRWWCVFLTLAPWAILWSALYCSSIVKP